MIHLIQFLNIINEIQMTSWLDKDAVIQGSGELGTQFIVGCCKFERHKIKMYVIQNTQNDAGKIQKPECHLHVWIALQH